MIINNILMQYGNYIIALLILENLFVVILTLYSLWHYYSTRKTVNQLGEVMDIYYKVLDCKNGEIILEGDSEE